MSFAHLFITVILFWIYPTCKFGLYSWTKGQLEPFDINKILGKCHFTDFIAILVYILYNVLLTCHLHVNNSNSVWIHPPYEFNCAPWFKGQLEPFWINKPLGKCYYTDFILILVYILYNVLLTCHLHIYDNNSIWIDSLYKFNCAQWFKA